MTEEMQKKGTIINNIFKKTDKGGYLEMWVQQEGEEVPRKQVLFSPALQKIAKERVGQEVVLTLFKEDKYWNVKGIDDPATAPALTASGGGRTSDDVNKRIAEQVAVKAICELVCADKLEINKKLGMKMLTWLDKALDIDIPIMDKEGDNPLMATASQIKAIKKEGDMDDEAFAAVSALDFPWGLTKADANSWLVRIRKENQGEEGITTICTEEGGRNEHARTNRYLC